MARPHTAKLDKERIRAAALDLVDSDGLAGLSMRKLAAELGASAPSLYFHYATKDDLIEDLEGEVMAPVDTSAFDQGWETGLRTWARSLRAALASHPNLVPVLAQGPGHRASSLQRADDVHGGLVGAGWPPRDATMIGAATKYVVFGAAMGSFSKGFVDDVAVYAHRYPHLSDAHRIAEHAEQIDRDSFDYALDAFIVGLRARFEALTR